MSRDVELTIEQEAAINEIDHNLQIVACAGSGKTEVITRRIANVLQSRPDVAPGNIVAFTFTKKAAESMRRRIEKNMGNSRNLSGMYIGTIHSYCQYILKHYSDQFEEYEILDTVREHLFVERYHRECGMDDLELEVCSRNIVLFLSCIEKMIDDYANREQWDEKHRTVFDKYRKCLREHQFIDFAFLIFDAIQQLQESEAAKAYIKRIKYLVVDEYQDVNDLQEKLIGLIVEAGANICVVGDDDQTIYQFRGSNADNMITFSERYKDVCQIRLEKNFRCVPGVVDIADTVIQNNDNRISKKMLSGIVSEETDILAKCFDHKEEQYDWIARKIRALHEDGVSYKDMAVLIRKGKYAPYMARALAYYDIPYASDSAEQFFEGKYFACFVNALQVLADTSKETMQQAWGDLLDRKVFNAGYKCLRRCATSGGSMTMSEILTEFCDVISFLDEAEEDYEIRKNDLRGVLRILDDFDCIYGDCMLSWRINTLLKFLKDDAGEEYKYASFADQEKDEDEVQILTIHKAKGLEYHSVFIPELEQREFPIAQRGGKQYWHVLGGVFEEKKDKYRSTLEDERKLFYVAVTRAKKNLYLTYDLSKQTVSEFVKEAASSDYLKIERADLCFNPKANDRCKSQ